MIMYLQKSEFFQDTSPTSCHYCQSGSGTRSHLHSQLSSAQLVFPMSPWWRGMRLRFLLISLPKQEITVGYQAISICFVNCRVIFAIKRIRTYSSLNISQMLRLHWLKSQHMLKTTEYFFKVKAADFFFKRGGDKGKKGDWMNWKFRKHNVIFHIVNEYTHGN